MQKQIPFFVFPDDYEEYERRQEEDAMQNEDERESIMKGWDIPETPPFAASDMATR